MSENQVNGKRPLFESPVPWEPPNKIKIRREIYDAVEKLKSEGTAKGREFSVVARQFNLDRSKIRYNYQAEDKERRNPKLALLDITNRNGIPMPKVFDVQLFGFSISNFCILRLLLTIDPRSSIWLNKKLCNGYPGRISKELDCRAT